jgi:hypothetical protein
MKQTDALTPRPTAHAVIAPELRAELERVARFHDRSLAAEVRQAIRAHLERERRLDEARR